MDFRPNKLKVILSLIVIVIWYLIYWYLFYNVVYTSPCNITCPDNFELEECPMYFHFFPEHICCECPITPSFFKLLVQFLIIISPGLLFYIIWSMFQKRK